MIDPNHIFNNLCHPNMRRTLRPSNSELFAPDWRLRQVLQYVDAADGVGPDPGLVLKWSETEPDVHVRRLFEFLQTGDCQCEDAYGWAWKCISENESMGLASVIRALNLAGWDAVEIAACLNVATDWVQTFLVLCWDIEHGRKKRDYIRSLVLGGSCRYRDTPDDLREGLLLLSTWMWKREGVIRMLTSDVGLTDLESPAVQREASWYESNRSQEKAFTIAFGGTPKVVIEDLYLDKLRSMEALPSRIERGQRETRFEKVMTDLSEGVPLSQFLSVPPHGAMPTTIESHQSAGADESAPSKV